jgi:hypothetical protein
VRMILLLTLIIGGLSQGCGRIDQKAVDCYNKYGAAGLGTFDCNPYSVIVK